MARRGCKMSLKDVVLICFDILKTSYYNLKIGILYQKVLFQNDHLALAIKWNKIVIKCRLSECLACIACNFMRDCCHVTSVLVWITNCQVS